MAKVKLIAAIAAALMTGAAAEADAQAYGGYLPQPAYAYAGEGAHGYQDEIETPGACGGTGFTILGARAGATVLGFDAGVGGHFGFNGFGGGCRRHREAPVQAYAPPPPQPFGPQQAYAPQAYPPMVYAPPPPAAVYVAPSYQAPSYDGPCGCQPGGW